MPTKAPSAELTLGPELSSAEKDLEVIDADDDQNPPVAAGEADGPLSYVERRYLAYQEKRIESGRSAFIAVAEALLIIKDQRLYRETHGTFEEYCRERWDFARNYANKLIASAEAVKLLPPELGTIVPNESVAREIAKVEPEHREKVVREAADHAKAEGRSVTARDILEARTTGKKPEEEENRQHLAKLKTLWTAAAPVVQHEFLQWAQENKAKLSDAADSGASG